MTLKQTIITFLLFYKIALFGGFSAETLVKIPSGYIPIKALKIGDKVICQGPGNEYREQLITHTQVSSVKTHLCVVTGNQIIITCPDQKFYLADKQIWEKAENLTTDDYLVDQYQISCPIEAIIPISEAIDLYDITVDNDHNFLITNQNFLVHNPLPIIVAGLPWACGAGAVKFASALGIASILGLIGVQMNKSRNRHNAYKSTFSCNTNNGSFASAPGGHNNDNDPDKKIKTLISFYEKNIKHIFRDAPGHLRDTLQNRQLLIEIASDARNFLGVDKYGNQWFAKNMPNGEQVWVSMRENLIRNGGINQSARTFNTVTGLCKF